MAENALALAVIFELCCDEEKPVKKKRKWCKEWLMDKQKYSNMDLLEKLRQTEPLDLKNYLRMDDDTFQILLQKVAPLIVKQNTLMRDAIPPEIRLSITLRFLATGNSFEDLKFSTAVSPQAIGKIVIETCEAICSVLKDYIKLPQTSEEWRLESEKFQKITGFPHCLGSIDGKHVEITKPKDSGSYYFNYKKTFSIVLMAVVNAEADFLMVDIGTNGRVSDGGVFSRTMFFEKLSSGQLNIPAPECISEGGEVLPYVFLGDDAFPLRPDLLKPYKQQHLTPHQEFFNKTLSRGRVKVENAFGILASRFRVLHTAIMLSPEKATKVALTCCYVHNFLRRTRGSAYTSALAHNEAVGRFVPMEPSQARNSSTEAKLVREKFCRVINGE